MTAALDAIRARHVPVNTAEPGFQRCLGEEMGGDGWDQTEWPCDAAQLLAALDRAETVVGAARAAEDALLWASGAFDTDILAEVWAVNGRPVIDALRAALRAYEDADKVADG